MAPRLLKWFRKKCTAFVSPGGKDLTLREGDIEISGTPNVDPSDRFHTSLSPGEGGAVPGMTVNFKSLVITTYPSGVIIYIQKDGTAESENNHRSQGTDTSAVGEDILSNLPIPVTPENLASVMKSYPSDAILSWNNNETDIRADLDAGRCCLLDSTPVTPDDSLTSVMSIASGDSPSWKNETDTSLDLDAQRCRVFDSDPVTPDNNLTSVMKRYSSGAIPSYSDMNAVRRRLFDSPPVMPDKPLTSVMKSHLSRAIPEPQFKRRGKLTSCPFVGVTNTQCNCSDKLAGMTPRMTLHRKVNNYSYTTHVGDRERK